MANRQFYSRHTPNHLFPHSTAESHDDVRKALREINFYGYSAAEVGGGDAERLKQISGNMDRVFALS